MALRGAVGIALGDKNALGNFDRSIDGFFRSFFAFVLALPFYLLISSAEWRIVNETGPNDIAVGFQAYIVLKIAAAGLSWVAFPLAVAALARPLGFSRQYVSYIVAYNWAQLPILAAITGPYFLFSLGLLPVGGLAFLHLMLLIGVLWYRWRIATVVLGATAGLAAGLVVLDIVLEIFIDIALAGLLR